MIDGTILREAIQLVSYSRGGSYDLMLYLRLLEMRVRLIVPGNTIYSDSPLKPTVDPAETLAVLVSPAVF